MSYKKTGLVLSKFSKSFLNTIQDNHWIGRTDNPRLIIRTVRDNDIKVAIVGLYHTYSKYEFFLIIAIHHNFRGMGYLEKITDLISKKFKIRKLYATIKKKNKCSIKAHKKAGFKRIGKDLECELKENGFLQNDEVRFFKIY